jgi:5-hydroxyisourate hydrolase
MNSLSTHVLDIGKGGPAADVDFVLEKLEGGAWVTCGEGVTDVNGRFNGFGVGFTAGSYRLRFDTGGYGNEFYPEVTVRFEMAGEEDHYHIPLLLSPHGYTTYRGS